MEDINWKRFWAPEGISTQHYDFLPDPEGFLGNKNLVTFDQIQDIPCLILLGNPGIGKSKTLWQIFKNLQTTNTLCVFADLRKFGDFNKLVRNIENQPDFHTWQSVPDSRTLHIFLDSLDEGRLRMKALEYDLEYYIEGLHPKPYHLRITCRASELPHDFFDSMEKLWKRTANNNRAEPSPQVQLYYLSQLRYQDAHQAASSYDNIQPDLFMKAIKEKAIEAIAAHPFSLGILLNIYATKKSLPNTRQEIYKIACYELAKEISHSRSGSGQIGEFGVEQRLQAARQIAGLSIVGNYQQISLDFTTDDTTLLVKDCYLSNSSTWSDPPKLIAETFGTALFAAINLNEKRYIWSHQSYSEYLAAEYFANSRIPLRQIKSLFVNPNDPQARIVPNLYETVAWLSTLRTDVFEWIISTEPIILTRSDSITLTDSQREKFVDHFINIYNSQEVIQERLGLSDLTALNHPKLDVQLRAALDDEMITKSTIQLIMDFILMCNISALDDWLITMALDTEQDLDLRIDALECLHYAKHDIENAEDLRSLVFSQQDFDVNSEISSLVLNIIWPKHLTASELFQFLYLPRWDEYQVSQTYERFLHTEVSEQVAPDDLPIALNWVAQQRLRDHELSLSGLEIVQGIMRMSWEHLDNEHVLHAFARAAWSRLLKYNPVVDGSKEFWRAGKEQRDYTGELRDNTSLRQRLLQAMLNVFTPDDLSNEELLSYLHSSMSNNFPFYMRKDESWLIEQSQNERLEERRNAYTYLLAHLPSQEAQTAEEAFRKEQEEKLATETVRVLDLINEKLEACEQDSANWWQLSQSLLMDGYGYRFHHVLDIRKGYGWRILQADPDTLEKVLVAATRYILEQNPYIGNKEQATPVMNHDQALEGYRALILMGQSPSALDQLPKGIWQRWASIIIANTLPKGDEARKIDELLLQYVFDYAVDEAFEQLTKVLENDREYDPFGNKLREMLARFDDAPPTHLADVLIKYLREFQPNDERFYDLLRTLLRLNVPQSHETQEIALEYLRELPTNDEEKHQCKKIISTLAIYSSNGNWWQAAWSLIESDRDFAQKVFGAIADWHLNPYLANLSEEQLYNLYLLAIEIYRFDEDIVFHGGAVPDRYTVQEWRDKILRELAARGTGQALTLVKQLREHRPDIPEINKTLELAMSRQREVSWIPPKPSTILQVVADANRRSVANADQLLDVIIDALIDIEAMVQGDASEKASIWNMQHDKKFRPVAEESFSDAIAKWLRAKLKTQLDFVVVDREVETRRLISKPRGKRTDILVQSSSDSGEPLMVIIEVKGCWFEPIDKPMQTQLVDDYIAKHDRCFHGLYLVGYFASDIGDKDDSRLDKCASKNKNQLASDLEIQKTNLIKPDNVTIKCLVFDASTP